MALSIVRLYIHCIVKLRFCIEIDSQVELLGKWKGGGRTPDPPLHTALEWSRVRPTVFVHPQAYTAGVG